MQESFYNVELKLLFFPLVTHTDTHTLAHTLSHTHTNEHSSNRQALPSGGKEKLESMKYELPKSSKSLMLQQKCFEEGKRGSILQKSALCAITLSGISY